MIFKEGDEATHLYIIKKGEVKISKKVAIKLPDDPFVPTDDINLKQLPKRLLEVINFH